jgi:flagellar protein FlaG
MHVMSEDEINSAGQLPAVNPTDSATSYQTSNGGARHGAGSTAAAQATAGSDAAVAAQPAKQPSAADEINNAVAAANANLASSNRTLEYRVDAATGISVAMIRDSQTGVVVQQIPGADIIALAKMLQDWSPGKHMLLDLIA